MSGGCTNCGRKGGCDSRKHEMMAEVQKALQQLYPTGRWDQRDHGAGPLAGGGPAAQLGPALAEALSQRLKAFALFCPGEPEDFSDYVYVLCLGRKPCLLEAREGLTSAESVIGEDVGARVQELYLRVSLSTLAPFAAVQELRMELVAPRPGERDWLLQQQSRAGVFDPVLLPRYQKLVAVLTEHGVRNVDFGEIDEAPEGFDGDAHFERFGVPATTANYLFFAGPTEGLGAEVIHATDVSLVRHLPET